MFKVIKILLLLKGQHTESIKHLEIEQSILILRSSVDILLHFHVQQMGV